MFSETPPFSWLKKVQWPADDGEPEYDATVELTDTIIANNNTPAPGSAMLISRTAEEFITLLKSARPSLNSRDVSASGFSPVNTEFSYPGNVSPENMFVSVTQDGDASVSVIVTDLTFGFGVVSGGTVLYGDFNVASAEGGVIPGQLWVVDEILAISHFTGVGGAWRNSQVDVFIRWGMTLI